MLRRIVGGIPNEWLRVDDEPRLPLGPDHVPRMQVGRQQHPHRCTARQFAEEAQALADQPCIGPSLGVGLRLPAPMRHQVRHWTEGVWLRWPAPEPTQKSCDHGVLFGFR